MPRALLGGRATACWCPAGSACAASRARSRRSGMPARCEIPFFGICLGMQMAVIEFARNVLGSGGRQQHRVRRGHAAPGDLPARRPARRSRDKGARCGSVRSRAMLVPGIAGARSAYGADRDLTSGTATATSSTPTTASEFEAAGLRITGTSPTASWSEIVETAEPPVVPGGAVPPRVQVEAAGPAPAVRGFVEAALHKMQNRTLG